MSNGPGNLFGFEGRRPAVAPDAFIAPNALLIGDIVIGSRASIWYGCTLRGDVNRIIIGDRSNLQDGTIVHGSPDIGPTLIGRDVLVGHGALIHGCELRDGSYVGMRAVVMNKAIVETGSLVAAGALVTEGTHIPSGEIWGGSPAQKIGTFTPKVEAAMKAAVEGYLDLSRRHAAAHATT